MSDQPSSAQETGSKKTDWRDGKHPLSVRIKDAVDVKFMEELISKTGNAQAALHHCVQVARLAPDAVVDLDEIKRLKDAAEQALRDAQQSKGGFAFDEVETKAITALLEKKKFKDLHETIRYALSYTLKNDWI